MKKAILIIFLLFAIGLSTKAQTIDTAFKSAPACKVKPFYNNPRTDTVLITHVAISNCYFDFVDRGVQMTYAFYSGHRKVFEGEVTITGDEYEAMKSASNQLIYLFTYLEAHIPGLHYQ
jgi:hypothetical protein